MESHAQWSPGQESHLFYQTRLRRPLLDRAEGIYLWDVHGKRYVDGSSGAMVSNIGHSNPRVLQAMWTQMQHATFGYRLHFETEPSERLASELAALAPDGHEKVFFCSGGSEAVESCIKLARQFAVATGQEKRWQIISREPSYHGGTLGALALTSYAPLNRPFIPIVQTTPKVPAPRCYLDRDNFSDAERGLRYAEMLRDKILEVGPETVLAFIMEPIGGASTGALIAPDTYYLRIREICDEFGILLIYDEVMTGAGRTGTWLAAEHWNINPDLIALAKGLGAGYAPLGAMLAHKSIVEPVLDSGGFQHGYTYAGNPLACTAGLAVLQEIRAGDLLANTTRVGALLRRELEKLKDEYPFIGDVRGKGLLLAFELVADRETMRPLPREFDAYIRLVELAYERGLIIHARRTRNGVEGDHFLVCPPMIMTESQIDEIIQPLKASLDQLADHLTRFNRDH